MRRVFSILGVAIAAWLIAPPTYAVPITYQGLLNGANENPANGSAGLGFALVTIDVDAHTLQIEVSFSDLTGPVIAAHIHCCTNPPGNIGVATQTPSFVGFPAAPSGTYFHIFDTTLASTFSAGFINNNGGVAGAEAALAAGLANGQAYFNIHTPNFPGGEIRAFLSPVPEPGSIVLLGAGLLGLAGARLRRDAVRKRRSLRA